MSNKEAYSGYFFIALFATAALCQYFNERKQGFTKVDFNEIALGALAGLLNMSANILLILAVQIASPWEGPVVFPLFSTVIITMSAGIGSIVYKESVAWIGSMLCAVGIFVATSSPTTLSQVYHDVKLVFVKR